MKKGLVQLFIGDGKGKTSLAVGSAIRAAGNGFKVLFFQFLKNGDSGEVSVLKSIPEIDFMENPISNTFVFSGDTEKANVYKDMYSPIIDKIAKKTTDGSYDMVVLDEAVDAYNLGIFPNLPELMKTKNEGTELILTGHEYKGIPIDALRDAADYITYLKKEKHPFDNGVYARKGIEF